MLRKLHFITEQLIKFALKYIYLCLQADIVGVKKLLEDGANPNVRDNAGWTPLVNIFNHI